MKRIGIYLPVSTEEQARLQDGSLVSQRERLLEYVESQNRREANWGTVADVYCDEGLSAKDMKRPEFQRLLQDIRTGRVNLILSTELSRLSRSIHDFCELWALFKKHETSFVTLREQFDSTTAAGEMMIFNLINFAQYERKQTAERISANWHSRAKRGLWNGGTIHFGFERNPVKKAELLPHPLEASQVKEVFELFLQVGSVRKTCLELTKRGISSKRYTNKHGIEKGARQITVMSLQRILTNRAYIGLREIGVKSGKVEVVPASWKPLVELALFNEAQVKLAGNKNKYKPDEWKRYPFPLTEMLVCGECGKNLGGKSGTSRSKEKHFYYGHPRQLHSDGVTHLKRCRLETVRAEKIETIILESLKSLANAPGTLDHWLTIYAEGATNDLPGLQGKLKTLENGAATLARRNENLIERLSDLPKEISAEGIYKQIQGNTKRIQELESTAGSLRSEVTQTQTRSVDRDRLLFRIKRTIQNLERTPVENRRGIYANLIQFAELSPTKLKLGVYAPSSPETKKAGNEKSLPAGTLSQTEPPRAGSCTVLNGARDWTRTSML